MELFGWQISRRIKDSSKKGQSIPALVPEKDDGAIISTAAGGHYGQYVDVSGGDIKNQNDLIRKYRWAASQPEIDMAINDIIDQAIASGDTSAPIALIMSDLDQPDRVKEEIIDQFNHVIKLLGFNHNATDSFRDWYVDGRLYYHLMIDPKNWY